MKPSVILKLATALPHAQEIDQNAAPKWVSRTTKEDGLSAKTVGRILSFIRGCWKHLRSLHVVDAAPFTALGKV